MKKKNFYPVPQDITNLAAREKEKNSTLSASRGIPGFLPCAKCGSTERKLGIGKGPHSASLRCGECDHFIKWISKGELARIEKGGQL